MGRFLKFLIASFVTLCTVILFPVLIPIFIVFWAFATIWKAFTK